MSAPSHDPALGPHGGKPGLLVDTRAVLRDRNVLPYLVGNMLSSTGTWFQTLGQAILVYRLTHSALLLGVVGFAQFAAVVVLAPWAGSAADRFDRQRLLIVTQLSASGITGSLTVVALTGHASAVVVIGFALALGITSAFSTPALLALVPSLVTRSRLQAAVTLNHVTFNVGRAIGPVLAAVVIHELGTTWAFGLNSCSYIVLVGALLIIHPLNRQIRPFERPRLRESIRLVLCDRRLAGLLYVVAAVSLTADPAATIGPAFVSHEFQLSDTYSGFLVGAFGAGAVTAAFTVAPRLRRSLASITATLALAGGGIVTLSLSPNLAVALGALFVTGLAFLSTNAQVTTRLQLEVAEAQLGRVMALWSIAFLGVRPVASLIDGAVAQWAGLRVAAFLMAIPALAGALGLAIAARNRNPTLSGFN